MDIRSFKAQNIWGAEQIITKPLFSFKYGNRTSAELLSSWKVSQETEDLADKGTLRTIKWADQRTDLEVVFTLTTFSDFPAVEWVINFRNRGKSDTPILEHLHALNVDLTRSGDSEYMLYHTSGSFATASDFTPMSDILYPSQSKKLSCRGGRSSDGGYPADMRGGAFPFFDLACDDGGIVFAVGWSGQWAAEFKRDEANGLNITAGMEHTHLKLYPGEEIRTPRMLMFLWDGERVDAHNSFRRFILKHHTPLQESKPVQCPVAALSWFKYNYGIGVTEANQVEFIDQFVENKINLEYYWLDAGWYEDDGSDASWHLSVGNWFPKQRAFPRGLKPVADHARKNGLGFVLWFEPERVYPGTWLFKEHPEWLLMPSDEMMKDRSEALLNLGNPEARRWLTNHISKMIEDNGISIYRQDFNFPPLGFWQAADAPDRQGISEIRHIEGLYAFWDELLRRHPDLIIDNCASGGRRIDLETISRSVALWRSDCTFDSEAAQSHTIGLNQYVPCTACGCDSTDPYIFRSHLSAGISLCWDPEKEDFNAEEARQRIKEFKLLRPLFSGDFYPLIAHSIASDVWCAYQLERKDLNLGAVIAFRRKESPYTVAGFKLHGLDPEEYYELTDIDSGVKTEYAGSELMEKGIELKMLSAPGSMIIAYNKKT